MAVSANDLKKGMAIKLGNDIFVVLETQHRTPGNLRAFVQATLRNIHTRKSTVHRFSSTEKVETVMLIKKRLEFTYKDKETYHFIDPNTYEDYELHSDVVGDAAKYLTENLACDIMFVEGQAVNVELPPTVVLKVVQSPEAIKGDSATNVMKTATVETGITVQVPLFIKEGELIKIDTRTGHYISRA